MRQSGNPPDSGFSYIDAIVALAITAMLIAGSTVFVRGFTGSFAERVRRERDLLRFTVFEGQFRKMASEIVPPWWSAGPDILREDQSLTVRAANLPEAAFVSVSVVDGTTVRLSGTDTSIDFRFHRLPEWRTAEDSGQAPVSIILVHPSGIESTVVLGGRVLAGYGQGTDEQ